MFFDSHIHNKGKESGGFLVGLEGKPYFEGVLTNSQALQLHNENYIAFYYVLASEINIKTEHKYLKYHPRREKYTPDEVIDSIRMNNPRCVIIDTLNEPYWVPYDYWKIARENPEIQFVFAHAGGYLINDFIKICHFQKNVWLDFSLTHSMLGQFGKGLPYINQSIGYALNNSFSDRILLGSDYPFYSQEEVYNYYDNLNAINMLNDNYLKLSEKIL